MTPARALSVLVVDDDPDAAESTALLLTRHGFRAAHATSGLEAVRLASADPPDVALIDLLMPRLDGYATALRLQSLGLLRTPVLIALTGVAADWDRERAAAAGFALHLIKPVPPDELVSLLKQCEQCRDGTW